MLRDLYLRIPFVGDVLRLGESLDGMREMNGKLAEGIGRLTRSADAVQAALDQLSAAMSRDRLQVANPAGGAEGLSREIAMLRGDVANWKREIVDILWMTHNRDVIQQIDFGLEHHPRLADPKRLLRYAAQINSQNGEDGMVHEIFRRIGAASRVFVEIGCGSGIENNTAFLLSQGWSGFWIDGQDAFLKLVAGRTDLQGKSLRCAVSFISRENVAGLTKSLGVPAEFDLLSIDLDQNTYYVWEGLDAYRPRVVVIEYNAAIPSDVDWKVNYDPARTWDGTNNFGASLKALEMLGRKRGYCLVGCDITGSNAFFVRSDCVADLFAEPFTAENHYEPLRNAMLHRRGHRPSILDRKPIAALADEGAG